MIKEFDTYLFLLINTGLTNTVFDSVMPFITNRAYYLLLPALLWIFIKDKRTAVLAAALSLFALVFSDGIVHSLKLLFERPRPFMELPEARVLVGRGRSFSMPSGHAASAFAVVIPLIALFGGFVRPYLIFGALLVTFSRIYVGVHYPTDVVAGAATGILSASLVLWAYKRSVENFKKASYFHVLLIFLSVITIFRVYYIFTGPLALSPDEAHYWDWARRPDLSYYSKGPMIAYIIAAGRALFGDNVFGVRIGSVVLSALSSIVLFSLVKRMFDGKTALYSSVLFQCIPLFSTYGIIMTIDAPLTFFWIASLYLVRLLSERDERDEKTFGLWIALGISTGIGLMSKYTMAFFFLCTFIYMLSDERLRKYLKRPHPYAGFITSLVAFSPVIIWNAAHNWVTFRHTAGHARLSDGFVFSIKDFFEFIGSQVGVISPVIFILIWIALIRIRGDRKGKFMLSYSAPVLGFFIIKSIQGKVEANWAMPAYITGIAAFSYYYLSGYGLLRKSMRYIVVFGLCLSVMITIAAHYPLILRLPPEMDPTARLRGWEELGRKVSEIAVTLKKRGDYFIVSNSYQITSELAFYVEGNPVTYCADTGRRMNQYDLWPGFENLINYNAIFVIMDDSKMPAAMKNAFTGCTKHILDIEEKTVKVKTFSIFECYSFKGSEKPRASSY